MPAGQPLAGGSGGFRRSQFRSYQVTSRNVLLIASMIVGLHGCRRVEGVKHQIAHRSPLVGAWLITATSVTTPMGASVNEDPQPGLYIFTERHFSNMLIPNPEGRLPFSADRTAEERLAAYDNFIADAGTYLLTDSTLIAENIIAKVPNVMPPHRSSSSLTYRYRFEGDSLVLTLRGGWAPRNGQITYRLVRLE